MFTHLYVGSQLARERQREMQAQADQQRLVRQLREHAKANPALTAGRAAAHPAAQAHPPSHAPVMTRTAAASSHSNWEDPSWPR